MQILQEKSSCTLVFISLQFPKQESPLLQSFNPHSDKLAFVLICTLLPFDYISMCKGVLFLRQKEKPRISTRF